MAFYGHRVNYEQVRSVSQREKGIIPPRICIGSGILKKCFDSSGFKTGFEPWELRDVMNRWEGGNAKYESGSDLGKLKSLLSQGKPVLVLRRVGSFKPGIVFGTWPEMHWVAVRGYNDKVQGGKIYFTDTNGADVEKSYDKFMSEWDWRIGDGLASETFKQKGVKPKTMVWVDRTPPSLTSSSSNGIASPSVSSVGQSQIVGLANKCIGVRNGNSESGTPLILWECNGNADQRWSLTSHGSLQGLAGKCIGVQNGNSEGGTPLILWECNGNADQRWSIQ